MRNFDYLKDIDYLRPLYDYCNAAEVNQPSNPDVSALNARRALEWIVRAIYGLKNIEVGERTSLFTLIDDKPFKEFVDDDKVMMAVHYVRKAGNRVAHLGSITKRESFFTVLNLYNIVSAILVKLRVVDDYAPFDNSLLPTTATMRVEPKADVKPTEDIANHIDIAQAPPTPIVVKGNDLTEAETRKYFIDMMLAEAGWLVMDKDGLMAPSKACVEIEVDGMPNNAGKGYADYVLFGANGKPLAVVEAKRTSVDPLKGRHQAELYADALERKYGVRPVIYCSNGYKTEIIDGLGYPVRNVYGFHTEEELALLIQRRTRHNIADLKIDDNITNRDYQKRAIRKVCERLNAKHRRHLLVMATGTGKTRVAISLSEVLMRNQWVKNILFLADRTALVKQAAKNFAKLLPAQTTCILSEESEPDMNARIMFSTYQTMINKIDCDTKDFSVGRFDLIIVDEAHRSVFGKYTAIFSYFDGFLVGLTATPRDEIERNTFDLFGTDAEDAFAYELKEAVDDGFLVPYRTVKRSTEMMRKGIRYQELDEESQKAMEPVWNYEKAKNAIDPCEDYVRDIESEEMFKYIFNTGTIDKVLQDLMEVGLKVESGDKIGKTIIFAYNHKHAALIVERFAALYPEQGSDFCVLIDNYVNYAQDLIDKFDVRGGLPQVSVSVDMLDTGIDVPDILNLVFFKPVHSRIKFMQMIGRGTRLSPDIFGPGKDKTEFYIFDWCGNFEYFKVNPNGKEAKPVQSLSERLFCVKTLIAAELQHAAYQSDTFTKGLHDGLKASLCGQIKELKDTHIAVREHWDMVTKYREAGAWTYISPIDALEITTVLAPLVVKSTDDEGAKKFDLLVLNIELSLVNPEKRAERSKKDVARIAQSLMEKASIPQVAAKMSIIKEVALSAFWENLTIPNLERVREELRDLMKFLTGNDNRTFAVDIEDTIIDEGEAEMFMPATYRQRIIEYLAEHKDLPAIKKIMNIEQLTPEDITELERIMWEELGTKEEYANFVHKHNMLCGDSVAAFIRAQVGVDRSVAMEKFSEFLSGHVLNSEQEDYLKSIIAYVCQNGDITSDIIINESPFKDFEWLDVFGGYATFIGKYVNTLHNAIVA